MHLFFVDDSGTVTPRNKIAKKHFLLGGLIIPESSWHNLSTEFSKICNFFRVKGEIKWRYFAQRPGREDRGNTLYHLNIGERDELRKELLLTLGLYDSIKIIIAVVHLPSVYENPQNFGPEEVYELSHLHLMTAYQLYLEQTSNLTGSPVNGIIICDHRNIPQDSALRNWHMEILKSKKANLPKYSHLVESLFLTPSHHSVGIQFADLISGAAFRYFEHHDNRWYSLIEEKLWKSQTGQAENFGLIKIGDEWKQKDAESTELLAQPNLR